MKEVGQIFIMPRPSLKLRPPVPSSSSKQQCRSSNCDARSHHPPLHLILKIMKISQNFHKKFALVLLKQSFLKIFLIVLQCGEQFLFPSVQSKPYIEYIENIFENYFIFRPRIQKQHLSLCSHLDILLRRILCARFHIYFGCGVALVVITAFTIGSIRPAFQKFRDGINILIFINDAK